MKKIFLCFHLILAVAQAQLTSQELIVNEILASNNTAYSPDGLTFPDAIELKNLTNGALDLSQYGISDSDGGARYLLPAGTVIPANGFLVIRANGGGSGLEADFKLSAGGETVHLTDPAGNTVDRVRFERQRTDISFGRLSDQSFAFFPTPTIGTENDDANALQSLIERPSIDQESGIYSGSLTVSLAAELGQQIHYTLDASQPTENSPLYSGPLTFSGTTVLKTIAIENGIQSEVGMRTFLFDAAHDLPVIILTTERFVDRQFVNDNITINESVYSRFDIDGRIRFDFLETDGSLPLSQYVEFEASGLSSLALPPINGKITARSKLGKGSLRHRIFPEKEQQNRFERILVRNTSQDFNGARMRDGLFSRFISTGDIVDLEHEGYRPSVLYVNGIYMGHINLREDDDSAFARQYYGFENPITREYVEYPGNGIFADTPVPNPTSADAVERVNVIRNVDGSLFDDALRASMSVSEGSRLFISPDPADQIRLSLHDYDFAFGGSFGFLPFGPGWNQRWPFSFSSSGSVDRTGDRARFGEETMQFTAAYLNLFAYESRMTDIVDEVAGELRSEIPATLEFYKQRQADVGRPVPPPSAAGGKLVADNMSVWEDEVSFIKDFVETTFDGALASMASNFGFSQVIDVTVSSNDMSMGDVRVHAFRVTPGRETGQYFPGIPLRLKAEPKPGHTFVRWEGDVSGTDASISPTFSSNSTVTAVFAQNSQQLAVAGTMAISEIFYNPPGVTEDAEFVEFLNLTSAILDLSGVSFSEGLDYTFPPGTILAANARLVIRPTEYQGNLDNDGETLTYIDAAGQVIESVSYNDGNPWPEAADGDGHSLVRIDPALPLLTSSPEAWRLSVQMGGNPGTEDSAVLSDSSSTGLLNYAFGGEGPEFTGEFVGNTLTLKFKRVLNADAVTFKLFESSNLSTNGWSEVTGVDFLSEEVPQLGRETVTIEELPVGNSQNFYRIEVREK